MKIYNTLNQNKEIFKTIKNNRIKLFVCGPTVYEDAHIGHARTYISFDLIKKYLEYKGFSVFYLQNLTNIDDKIIKKSIGLNISASDLADKFENRYLEDMKKLKVDSVNFYAKATDYIPEMINQIQILLDKDFAYITEDGVYFDVYKFEDYGKLSNRKIEDLTVHRISKNTNKKNQVDFALWKKTDNGPVWDSPWGQGRPGWHIEDTAITEEYFGPQYDIHGGGLDLIFPHHEAEIAQMEVISNQIPMTNYWLHTGFLNVSGEKMSKSLGNFITIRDLLKKYDADVFRFFVLSTHYRSPIDFNEKILEQSEKTLYKIKKFIYKISNLRNEKNQDEDYIPLINAKKEFDSAMDDDFNTPKALAVIFTFINNTNTDINNNNLSDNIILEIIDWFKNIDSIFCINLFNYNPESSNTLSDNDQLLDLILDFRQKLRDKKYYDLSDELRDKLADQGFNIED